MSQEPWVAVLVAAAVGIAAGATMVWWSDTGATGPCGSGGAGNPPLGSAPALGVPAEATAGGLHWYNFTVLGWGNAPPLDRITFSIRNATGAPVLPTGSSLVHVVSPSGGTLGTYDLGTSTWLAGSGASIASGDRIDVGPTPTNLSGDTFFLMVAPGGGADPCAPSFLGTISVSIP